MIKIMQMLKIKVIRIYSIINIVGEESEKRWKKNDIWTCTWHILSSLK